MEGGRRASKHTQSWEEWWRWAGGVTSTLRAGREPNALRAGSSGGAGQEGRQTHSKLGGVVEGARRAAKRTQSREECRRAGGQPNILRAVGKWWRGAGEQPNTLRAGRSGGGLHHYDIITVSEP